MNMTSPNPGRYITGSALKRVAVAVAFAAIVSSLPLRVAFADDNDRRGQDQHQDRGRYDNQDHGRRGPPPRASRYHRYPVYAPPPVYYPRDDSPGIRLVFPINIR
jgi:hypothetical protein